jgi:hypothetical protein
MPNAITPLIQQYTVDFASNNNFLFVKGIQGDGYGTRYVDISLMNNGQPYTVNSEAVTVAIRGTKPDTSVIFNECEILDNNTIRVEITQQMSAIAGKGSYEISIISNFENRTLTSFPFFIVISKSSFDIGYVVSSDEFALLVDKINQVHKIQVDLSDLKSDMQDTIKDCEDATEDCIEATNEAKDATDKCKEATNICIDVTNTANETIDAMNALHDTVSDAERIRITNENQRISNENIRKQNEIDRQNAEQSRQATFDNAIADVTLATQNANDAANLANAEAANANKATERANNISTDLENKVATGYFNGKDGKDGIDGNDGIVTTLKGQIAFEIENGDLMVYYSDDDSPPDAHIDENGCLILTIE